MPFGFTPKQAGGSVHHGVLVTRDVERCDRADFVYIQTQHKDSDQLLCNKTGTGCHPLDPAHCGAVVAEKSYPLFGKRTTDMLHHQPEDNQPCKFQVQVRDFALMMFVQDDIGCDIQRPLELENRWRAFRQLPNDYSTHAVA
jgi:hypothetical protein